MKGLPALALSLVLSLGAGAIGSIFTVDSVREWYPALSKPSWNPPGWVFGPVWTGLYILMGIAAWRIWEMPASASRNFALWLYLGQLILNAAWSGIFFGLKNLGLAASEIGALLLLILATTVCFWRLNPVAGAMLIPYCIWVSFATALNFAIWRMN